MASDPVFHRVATSDIPILVAFPKFSKRQALALTALTALLMLPSPGCSSKKGSLMLAINTDMKAPKDVNAVAMVIRTGTQVKYTFIDRVAPDGEVHFPATVAIVEPDDPNATINIRVLALQETKPRVLRDVRTTVPRAGRVGLLRLPLNFVSDESATGALPATWIPGKASTAGTGLKLAGPSSDTTLGGDLAVDMFTTVSSICTNPNETTIDGECKDDYIDSSALPDFSEHLLGSEDPTSGACFDLKACFGEAMEVGTSGSAATSDAGAHGPTTTTDAGFADGFKQDAGAGMASFHLLGGNLDLTTCTMSTEGLDLAHLNLALVSDTTGECLQAGQCFVPLDKGDSGWNVAGGVVQLSSGICKKISRGARLFQGNGTCAPKTAANPICRDTSKAPPATDTAPVLVAAMEQPTTVAFVGTGIYAVGSEGAFALPTTAAGAGAGASAIDGFPKKVAPWFMTPALGANSGLAFVATDGLSTTGQVVTLGGSAIPATATVNTVTASVSGVMTQAAYVNGQYFWGVQADLKTPGGIFQSAGSGTATKLGQAQNLPTPVNVTAIAAIPLAAEGSGVGAFVFGDEVSNLTLCAVTGPDGVSCQPSANIGPPAGKAPSRIDAIAIPFGFAPNAATGTGYVLLQDGRLMLSAIFSGQSAQFSTLASGPANAARADTTLYYPRGLAADNSCAYYSTGSGLAFARQDAAGGPIVQAGFAPVASGGQILGVALGIDVATGKPHVYFALWAPKAGGGGIYRVPVPAECAGNSVVPVCKPVSCTQVSRGCGPMADGCGNILQCGTCAAGQVCSASGQCGSSGCTPRTCAQAGANCGPIADNCGGVLDCGTCTPPATCGGGGVPSMCGAAAACTPRTCAQAGANCGPVADNCGGILNCGTCTPPAVCGGVGIPSVCGVGACAPSTCAQMGANCGPIGDGCGGILNCGTCIAPDTCGGLAPSQCGH